MKNQRQVRHLREGGRAGVTGATDFDEHLVIRLPDWRVLLLIARSLLLSIAIISFPWMGTRMGFSSPSSAPIADDATTTAAARSRLIDDAFFLPMLFRDLKRLGLLRPGSRAVFLGHTNPRSPFLKQNKMDRITPGDEQHQRLIPDQTIEFVFTGGSGWPEFIDRALKIGGIVAVRLGSSPSEEALRMPSNYKTVYIRRFGSTIVAMRKMWHTNAIDSVGRRLLAVLPTKKEALSKLEDALLEPPWASSGHPNKYLKRTRYLPDLTGDTLEGYPRRVFVDVGSPGLTDGARWFTKHYPTRNRHFEMIRVETAVAGVEDGMSEWLKRNVREEDYVVTKAEAEVVEEMVKSGAIGLVDELFFECKHQWQKGAGRRGVQSRRAYWECLALYGKLRDEGVAVHQWWD